MRSYAFSLILLVGLIALDLQAVEQPNVLFILADDMGWQDTSVSFGPKRTHFNERYQTPALELLKDWLFQVQGQFSREVVLEQIRQARELIYRLKHRYAELDLRPELTGLKRLVQNVATEKGDDLTQANMTDVYLAVRRIKRRILFQHPAIDFNEILCIDQPYPRFPRGRPWPYNRRGGQICRHENSHRNGMMATPGGRLVILEGLNPWAETRSIGPEGSGSYWRPDLSFDGRRVLFCFKPEQDQAFHLYEGDVDGRAIRQLTDGKFDDIDPIYLPDGHILFVTTRCHTYVRCMPHANSYVLARCDSDGRDIYLISRGNECDWLPVLQEDGRVLYSRWEYTDKPLWRARAFGQPILTGRNHKSSGATKASGPIIRRKHGLYRARGASCSRPSDTTIGSPARSV